MADDRIIAMAARVRRHSALVRHMRLAIPALAAGLAITYALSATPPTIDREFAEQFAAIETGEDGVRLASPRYSGEDLQGQPFEVVANTATRSAGNDDQVDLANPQAVRVSRDGSETTVRAAEGLYDQDAQVMDLTRAVELHQKSASGDFVLRTEAAKVNLDSQVVTSDSEVRGEGETGSFRADRGTVYQNEDRIVLEGGVRISLAPKKKADAEADDGQERDKTDKND